MKFVLLLPLLAGLIPCLDAQVTLSKDANPPASNVIASLAADGGTFTGTGISNFLVNGATVPAALTFVNHDVLHFQFSPALQMQENSANGFLISLEDGSATSNGTNSDLRLQLSRDNVAPNGETYPDGRRIDGQLEAHDLRSRHQRCPEALLPPRSQLRSLIPRSPWCAVISPP